MLAGFIIIAYGDGASDFVSAQVATIAREEFDASIAQASLLISLSSIVGSVALLAIGQ